jgi:hypothetical protein
LNFFSRRSPKIIKTFGNNLIDVALKESGGDGLVDEEEDSVQVAFPRLLLRRVDKVDQEFQNLVKTSKIKTVKNENDKICQNQTKLQNLSWMSNQNL